MDILGEPRGVQGKLPPARRPWRGWGRQMVTVFKCLKCQRKEMNFSLLLLKPEERQLRKFKKKKKRPESGIIKNFLVACGVLMEGAAVINMSLLLLLAFRLKVRPAG